MTSITDIEPGDYVKTGSNRYEEVASTYGTQVRDEFTGRTRLAKPSEGFFGVRTVDGSGVSGWSARAYVKRDELPEGAYVVGRD